MERHTESCNSSTSTSIIKLDNAKECAQAKARTAPFCLMPRQLFEVALVWAVVVLLLTALQMFAVLWSPQTGLIPISQRTGQLLWCHGH